MMDRIFNTTLKKYFFVFILLSDLLTMPMNRLLSKRVSTSANNKLTGTFSALVNNLKGGQGLNSAQDTLPEVSNTTSSPEKILPYHKPFQIKDPSIVAIETNMQLRLYDDEHDTLEKAIAEKNDILENIQKKLDIAKTKQEKDLEFLNGKNISDLDINSDIYNNYQILTDKNEQAVKDLEEKMDSEQSALQKLQEQKTNNEDKLSSINMILARNELKPLGDLDFLNSQDYIKALSFFAKIISSASLEHKKALYEIALQEYPKLQSGIQFCKILSGVGALALVPIIGPVAALALGGKVFSAAKFLGTSKVGMAIGGSVYNAFVTEHTTLWVKNNFPWIAKNPVMVACIVAVVGGILGYALNAHQQSESEKAKLEKLFNEWMEAMNYVDLELEKVQKISDERIRISAEIKLNDYLSKIFSAYVDALPADFAETKEMYAKESSLLREQEFAQKRTVLKQTVWSTINPKHKERSLNDLTKIKEIDTALEERNFAAAEKANELIKSSPTLVSRRVMKDIKIKHQNEANERQKEYDERTNKMTEDLHNFVWQ
jgi:hypothetical protein